MVKLAIIGVSGRKKEQISLLSKEHMLWMMDNVYFYIVYVMKRKFKNVTLVSGGSAWSDHIAIKLFLTGKFKGLELYLPATFNLETKRYGDSHEGKILNLVHSKCQEKTNYGIFDEIASVINHKNTKIILCNGFFDRNSLIAKNSDYLIAFSMGDDICGGTMDTWNKVEHENKINFNLLWS